MTKDNVYVICNNTAFEFSITFVKDQLFASKEEAEVALAEFQEHIDEEKKELAEYGITIDNSRSMKIVTLRKFMEEFEETIYESGRENGY
jgi:hypothetical protein